MTYSAQGVGLVDEVAERARQGQGFGGDAAGGLEGPAVFVPHRLEDGGGLVSIVRHLLGRFVSFRLGAVIRLLYQVGFAEGFEDAVVEFAFVESFGLLGSYGDGYAVRQVGEVGDGLPGGVELGAIGGK